MHYLTLTTHRIEFGGISSFLSWCTASQVLKMGNASWLHSCEQRSYSGDMANVFARIWGITLHRTVYETLSLEICHALNSIFLFWQIPRIQHYGIDTNLWLVFRHRNSIKYLVFWLGSALTLQAQHYMLLVYNRMPDNGTQRITVLGTYVPSYLLQTEASF